MRTSTLIVFEPPTPPAHLPEHAKQLRLKRQAHLTDLIEQERAAVREFEASDPALQAPQTPLSRAQKPLSIKVSETAAQFTRMKGRSRRMLLWWMDCAINSYPFRSLRRSGPWRRCARHARSSP